MANSASTLPALQSAHRFHFYMAGAFVSTGFLGFAPTYWAPLFQGVIQLPPILHLHAALFYGWLLFYLRQSWLASSGQIARHREWGMAGVALASGMFFVGIAAAINTVKRSEALSAASGEAARRFLVVSVTGAFVFAVLFALAVVYVKRPEIHKRLMLVATASLLQAAIGRWFALALAPSQIASGGITPPPVAVTILPGLLSDLFIVAAMIHDRSQRGSVHPVYWAAGGVVLAVQVLRAPVATSDSWMAISNWLVSFAP
ncbi:MAG: hypothetical protein KJZ84_04485 [Bryobacteraceae bacterium]|nr:hypothetical protein [Bryobacteraceae bacterium]